MLTTTHILDWLGIIFLTVGMTYRVGGWRNYWVMLKKPIGANTPTDPRYWWATPVALLGAGLLVLSHWRSWVGV